MGERPETAHMKRLQRTVLAQSALQEKLSQIEAERDRYREALELIVAEAGTDEPDLLVAEAREALHSDQGSSK